MKKIKNIIAIELLICMIFQVFPVHATEFSKTMTEITENEIINKKSERIRAELESKELNVIKGHLEDEVASQTETFSIQTNSATTQVKPEIGSAVLGKTVWNLEGADSSGELMTMAATVSSSDYESVIMPAMKNGVKHPHIDGRSSSEYVSPFDGTLQLNFTDLYLPGRNGLDLSLNRFYKSEMSTVEASNATGEYTVNPTTYYNKRYALGLGWSFGFPSVEVRRKYDGSIQAFYHDGTGAAYRSNYNDSTKNEDGEEYYNGNLVYCTNLDNYYTDNVRFREKDRSYTRDGYSSYYSFKTADNTMQYFGKRGELLAIKDRFGNEIKFDYTEFPGENIIPYYSYDKYSFGSYWSSSNNNVFVFNSSSSTRRTSETRTQFVDIDELEKDYYVSLMYEAVDNLEQTFDGTFQIYCDLYKNSTLLGSVLVAEETPTVHNEMKQITGEFTVRNQDFDDVPNRARIRIKMVNGRGKIGFKNLRFSPKTPLITKITDTIGRTVEFDYQGDIYLDYEDEPTLPIETVVKDPAGNVINELTYYRNVFKHTEELDGMILKEHRFYFFWGCYNGNYSTFVDYAWNSGRGSSRYANENINYLYDFYGRPLVNYVEWRNATSHFEYEKVRKWTDNRPWGSTATATISNTGFIDTWRVTKRYNVDYAWDDTIVNPEYNCYQYNYSTGYYTDETGYNRKGKSNMEPGSLLSNYGNYIVIVTNPNGSNEKYEYTTHVFDEGFRRRWTIDLPLLDKKTVTESSAAGADSIIQEYSYTDNYALISPTQTKTTETINGTSRVYYTKTEYDSDSCLPVVSSLPLTEAEAAMEEIPATKRVKTTYQTLSNRLFVPVKKEYYQKEDGEMLSESYTIDTLGRVTSERNAKGDTVYYEYDSTYPWQPSRIYYSDPENTGDTSRIAETLYTYADAYGLGATEEHVKYADGNYATSSFVYEPQYGNITEKTDPNGNKTTYSYDWEGRLSEARYPSYSSEGGLKWLKESYSYSNYGSLEGWNYSAYEVRKRLHVSANANYSSTTLMTTESVCYNDMGNPLYASTEMGEEAYLYDAASRLVGYQNQADYGTENNTLTYAYDGFDRTTTVTDRLGNLQKAVYKSLSKEYSFIPSGSSTAENHYTEQYDMYGRKIAEKIYPNGISSAALITSYEYDLAGNVRKVTDANGKVTETEYDALNQPVRVIRADGSVITQEHTKWGTTKKINRHEEEETYSISETYDDRGLAVTHRQIGTDIQTRPWNYSYRADGSVSITTKPDNTQMTYGYDAAGNNTVYTVGNLTDTMQYNHFGQTDKITRSVNGAETDTVDYTYDQNKGLLLSKQTGGKTTAYTYNALGSLTSMTSPSSLTRSYTRDALERTTQVSVDGKTFGYEYYGDGMIKKITYPTGNLSTEYTYDNANRMKTMVTKAGGTTLKSYTYTYDKVGNILSVSGSENTSYTYDNLYRLSSATANGKTIQYAYDSRDNLISETSGSSSKTYEYSGDNRLKKVTENGVVTAYEYDLNGNLIRRGEDEFAYDLNDKLVYAKVDGVETTYQNGAEGLRKSKTVNGETTTYALDENGNVITENGEEIILGHKPLAKKVNEAYYYYIYNGHGDVVLLVDENGSVKNSYTYDAWGNIQTSAETIPNNHKYAGEYFDKETGFIYLRNRYYAPETKRFTSEDPARDDLNWYVYCGNNPINLIDPSGLAEMILSYVINAYGGKIYYDEPKNTLYLYNQSGQSMIVDTSDLGYMFDRFIIDSDVSKDLFAEMNGFLGVLGMETYRHQEDQTFITEGDAVLAFKFIYHPISMSEQREYGANIQKTADGRYKLSNVVNHLTDSASYNDGDDGRNGVVLPSPNGNTVGTIHTHWHPNGSLYFSDADLSNQQSLNDYMQRRLHYYLVNREGRIQIVV